MHHTEGIVLKKLDVGEHDALYSMYTRDFGKMRALAQGVRREEAKLRGHLEPLSLARVQFVIGRGGEKLIGATLADFFPRLRSREHTLLVAAEIAREVDIQCFPGEKDTQIWELLNHTFAVLDHEEFSEDDMSPFLTDFRARFRVSLGYGASDEEGIV